MKFVSASLAYPGRAAARPLAGIPSRVALAMLLIAAAYVLASRLGAMLAIPPGITAVYPPSGIALAALLVWGVRLWPGVWLGAFIAAVLIFRETSPLGLAAVIAAGTATGATLQGIAGALLLRRFVREATPFERAEDVFRFLGLGAAAGLISPTLGCAVLLGAGALAHDALSSAWLTWWLGDFTGVVVFTPLLLTLVSPAALRLPRARVGEAAVLLALFMTVAHFVIGVPLPAGLPYYDFPLPYPFIPFVIWAALRFGAAGVSAVMLLMSVAAIWGTAHDLGPFIGDTQNQSLLFTQAFLGVVAVSGLALAAAIRERERAEAASREAREALYRILERISEGFYALDPDWHFSYVNHRAETYFGRPRGELLGRVVWEAVPVAADSPLEPRYRRAMRTGRPERFELRSPLTGRWIEVHADPSPEGLSVYFQDIDEQKRAKETLERTARDLARSNSDLEQFAHVASHDLQEPLRGLTGCVQLLAARPGLRADKKVSEYMAHALAATQRMEAMIRDLLDFSRIDRGGRAFEPVELDAVLVEARDNLAEAIRESGCEIDAAPLPRIAGDRSRLVRLFQNLLGNAIKFRDPRRAPRVRITARRRNDAWAVWVADNGIGVAPEHAERIFRLFQRLRPRRVDSGTGLGLAICRKIVEQHGGEIRVESIAGEGSTFHFTLRAEANP